MKNFSKIPLLLMCLIVSLIFQTLVLKNADAVEETVYSDTRPTQWSVISDDDRTTYTADGSVPYPFSQGMALDSTGNIYVSLVAGRSFGKIKKFSATGTFIDDWDACRFDGAYKFPYELAVGPDNSIYYEGNDMNVYKIAPDGSCTRFNTSDPSLLSSGINNINDLEIGSDGYIYVAGTYFSSISMSIEPILEKYSPGGTLSASMRIPDGIRTPQIINDIVFGKDGFIYALIAQYGKVYKFNTNLEYQNSFDIQESGSACEFIHYDFFSTSRGSIATDRDGNIYIFCKDTSRPEGRQNTIKKYSPEGVLLSKYIATPPHLAMIIKNNNLYILDGEYYNLDNSVHQSVIPLEPLMLKKAPKPFITPFRRIPLPR